MIRDALRAELDDCAGDLVAQGDGLLVREPHHAFEQVGVRVAEPGCFHADEGLAGAGRRDGHVGDAELEGFAVVTVGFHRGKYFSK